IGEGRERSKAARGSYERISDPQQRQLVCEAKSPGARDEDVVTIQQPVFPFLKATDHHEQRLRPSPCNSVDEGMPRREQPASIGNRRSLGQRTLARIDDHEGTSAQFRRVKMARPSLISARRRKHWNVTMPRVKRVDAAVINRKILPHL